MPATEAAGAASPQRSAAAEDPQALAAAKAARAALTAGRASEAVRLADQGLAKHAGSRQLTMVKVEGLIAAGQLGEALKAYDTRLRLTSQDDLEMLGVLARAELWSTARGQRGSVAAEALEALAANGDAAARQELQKRAARTAEGGGAFAIEALARLGDAAAAADFLAQAGKTEGSRRADALRTLASLRGKTTPAIEAFVRQSLELSDPVVQGVAADTAASLGLTTLLPDLQKRYASTHPMARLPLTMAMAKLGDSTAKERVRGALQSPASSVRLRAATVLRDLGDNSWADTVRPLMADPDRLSGLLAAELMLAIDHPAAWKVLVDATVDPNPVIRAEAARIMSADPKGDRPFLRAFLSDDSVQVRLPAARALASAPASPGRQSSK